jgi:2-oxoisovalerate dehydrogenase E1 component
MPGLKALYPSTPQDAFNALLAAYEDNNPVILFEHKALYRRGKGPVAWDANYRDIWSPKKLRAGDYATLITYGDMVHLAEDAADYLAAEYEITLDVFDLRALAPLRLEAIEASLQRTGRLIVLHEGRRTHGFGAELVARIADQCFEYLDGPVRRVAYADRPSPYAKKLEASLMPDQDAITRALRALARY